MIAGYVVLDGFDLGAGIIHLWVARTDERAKAECWNRSAPFWDGNEVWLLAAGGTLFCAFPALYSASFKAGFGLPLMMVLWLLMLRGIAIEFRAHVEGPLWRPLWDVVFAGLARCCRDIFWGGVGECGARGAAGGELRVLFLTAMD